MAQKFSRQLLPISVHRYIITRLNVYLFGQADGRVSFSVPGNRMIGGQLMRYGVRCFARLKPRRRFSSARQGIGQSAFDDADDDRENADDPDWWDGLEDEESFDPEPLDDSALEDFEFDEVPDDVEPMPEESWDDADEG